MFSAIVQQLVWTTSFNAQFYSLCISERRIDISEYFAITSKKNNFNTFILFKLAPKRLYKRSWSIADIWFCLFFVCNCFKRSFNFAFRRCCFFIFSASRLYLSFYNSTLLIFLKTRKALSSVIKALLVVETKSLCRHWTKNFQSLSSTHRIWYAHRLNSNTMIRWNF